MSYANPSITASGTTFAQFQAAGASGHLERLIAAQAATLAPTVAATATPTGGGASGGLIAAGTYYFVVTETNGIGETTIGPESALLTVATANIPRITFQTLKTGNTARNVYLSALNAATGGPYFLYATGITAATYDLAALAPVNSLGVNPPKENSTALTFAMAVGTQNETLELLRGAKDGNLDDAYRYLRTLIHEFNRGEPLAFGSAIAKLRHAHTTFAMLATLCAEMGTLIDANPGTLKPVAMPIGTVGPRRSWP